MTGRDQTKNYKQIYIQTTLPITLPQESNIQYC
jgi:hypothetical protein